ncbi:MAG: helix-hairpin-helix domain-containing protein [Alphaproteobacteria bacterium]
MPARSPRSSAPDHLKVLDEVEARLPSTLAVLTSIPGLGPKRVQLIHQKLGVSTLDQLAAAARAGKLQELPRFSAGLEAKILADITAHQTTVPRFKLSTAEDFAREITAYLRKAPGIGQVVVARSFRRRRETVGDLDFLVTAKKGTTVIDHFVAHPEVVEVLSKGTTRAGIRLRSGVQVDLRVVAERSYGAALHYFTGSKAHNIAVRKLALGKGLKLNEYGVFKSARRVAGRTEEDVFRAVGLPFIEPELREDRGEVEAALAGKLPHLVQLADIKGDLHAHTDASDGKSRLEEMAGAAQGLGYSYLAITDHSRHATVAHGLDPRRLGAQLDAIDRLNEKLAGALLVLKSCEVDILADGKLDLPASVLSASISRSVPFTTASTSPSSSRRSVSSGQWTTAISIYSPIPWDGFSASVRALRSILIGSWTPRTSAAAFWRSMPIPVGSIWTTAIAVRPRSWASSCPWARTRTRPSASMRCASASTRDDAAGSKPPTCSTRGHGRSWLRCFGAEAGRSPRPALLAAAGWGLAAPSPGPGSRYPI